MEEGGLDVLLRTYASQAGELGSLCGSAASPTNAARLERFLQARDLQSVAARYCAYIYADDVTLQARQPDSSANIACRCWVGFRWPARHSWWCRRQGSRSCPSTLASALAVVAPHSPVVRFQERVFYESRFGLLQSSEDAPELMHRVKLSFLEGLHWCLLTAAGACPSWTWQYPFHFAPRTQDMTALK